MLTAEDIAFIRANRAEILAGRTEPITYYRREQTGTNPITGEPIFQDTAATVDVVLKEFRSNDSRREMVGGVELLEGDVRVTFPSDFDFDGVTHVEKDGVLYSIIAQDRRGLGGVNRVECVVRRVT
jgi:hypothetical protein